MSPYKLASVQVSSAIMNAYQHACSASNESLCHLPFMPTGNPALQESKLPQEQN